jgi:hypothetical protein
MNTKPYTDWISDFNEGRISERELFEGLISCARFEDARSILSCLDSEQRSRFRALLDAFAEIKNDDEIIKIGNPPHWGKSEVTKILNAFSS